MRKSVLKEWASGEVAPLLSKAKPNEYPTAWSKYVGQEPAKRMLRVAAQSARMRNEPLDHYLIGHGTPGIGKTALANLVARELKRPARLITGPLVPGRARLLFSQMKDRDVLVYDEFHQVMDAGKKNAEWLLSYLQDGTIDGPLGPEPQPRVTIIAATTDVGRLPEPIVSRFVTVPMEDYSEEEAAKIAQVMAPRILGKDAPKLSRNEALTLAVAAHCNPRAIKQLLVVLRDATITRELPMVNGRYDVKGLLDWQGITHDGLDYTCQRYLQTLATEFDGTAGAKALEDRLQQPGGLTSVERVLIDKGLVARTRTGRTLTQAGIRRFNELMEVAS